MTNRTKWTPGPWTVENHTIICKHGGGSIGDMTAGYPQCPFAEMQANALLAAAAPDLYAALKRAQTYVYESADQNPRDRSILADLDAIDAALARADGDRQ